MSNCDFCGDRGRRDGCIRCGLTRPATFEDDGADRAYDQKLDDELTGDTLNDDMDRDPDEPEDWRD